MHCTHMLCASSRSLPLVLDEILLLFASIVRYESALARVLVCPNVPVLPPILSSLNIAPHLLMSRTHLRPRLRVSPLCMRKADPLGTLITGKTGRSPSACGGTRRMGQSVCGRTRTAPAQARRVVILFRQSQPL